MESMVQWSPNPLPFVLALYPKACVLARQSHSHARRTTGCLVAAVCVWLRRGITTASHSIKPLVRARGGWVSWAPSLRLWLARPRSTTASTRHPPTRAAAMTLLVTRGASACDKRAACESKRGLVETRA
jgi:hypothetical protein